jgi:hypothetical protein
MTVTAFARFSGVIALSLIALRCGSSSPSSSPTPTPTPTAPPTPSGPAITTIVAAVRAPDGTQATQQTGAQPAAAGGPAITVFANPTTINGGSAFVRLQSASAFQTVYVSVPSTTAAFPFVAGPSSPQAEATGYFQLRLPAPTNDTTIGLTFGPALGTTFTVGFAGAAPAGAVGGTVTLPQTVVPAPGTASGLFGSFNITATKSSDTGCNFSNSFTGQLQLSGNTDGSSATARMIERLTRAYAGAMQSNGSYSGTGTGNLDGFIYSGSMTAQVTGNLIQGTETLNFTAGCPGRQVLYAFTGNR